MVPCCYFPAPSSDSRLRSSVFPVNWRVRRAFRWCCRRRNRFMCLSFRALSTRKTPRKITISCKEADKNKNENYKFRLSVSEWQSRPSFLVYRLEKKSQICSTTRRGTHASNDPLGVNIYVFISNVKMTKFGIPTAILWKTKRIKSKWMTFN